jgi:TetR/AcrR family transcriptional regulator
MATVNRRDSILDAARLEFASGGYAGGRIERIAGVANVNKQLIFHYFRSKDGLYCAVVLAAVSGFRLPLASAASPPDALRKATRSIMDSLGADEMLVAVLVDCAIRTGVPLEARAAVAAWTEGIQKTIRGIIAEGQRQGFFRDDIWPDTVAENVVNECIGSAVRRIVRNAGRNLQDVEPSNNETSIGEWAADYCAWR